MNIDKAQVARQFSKAASRYDEFTTVQKAMADRLLREIPSDATGSLIDLGCGTGKALQHLCQTTSLVLTGVDIAASMIDVARKRVPNGHFAIEDLEQTSFDSQGFDYVFSNAALQWCNVRPALKEMHRLLRPGGKLLLTTFADGTLAEWQLAWQAASSERRVHRFTDSDQLAETLKQVGFRSVEVSQERHIYRFDSIDDMIDSVRKIGATYAAPDRQRAALSKQMLQRFRESLLLNQAGQTQLSYECLFVFAMV